MTNFSQALRERIENEMRQYIDTVRRSKKFQNGLPMMISLEMLDMKRNNISRADVIKRYKDKIENRRDGIRELANTLATRENFLDSELRQKLRKKLESQAFEFDVLQELEKKTGTGIIRPRDAKGRFVKMRK